MGLAAIALCISLITIGRESLWFDETVTLRVMRMGSEPFFETILEREPFWGLYYGFMRAWIAVGDSAVLLRLPSAIAASATVGLTYLVGRRLIGETPALVGALVLIPHAFLLQYAQEARGYSVAVALVVASTLAFVHARERPTWRRWGLYAVIGIAAVYAHFFAAFVLAAHGLVLLAGGREWLRAHWILPAAALGIIGAVAWPLASWLLAAEQTRRFMRAITFERLTAAFGWFGGAGTLPVGGPLFLLLAAAAAVTMGLAVVHLVARARSTDEPWRPVLLAAWLTLPLILSLVISVTIKPVFTYRYLIVSLPAIALAVGMIVVGLRRPPLRAAASLLTVGVLLTGAGSVLLTANKPDWNGAAREVLDAARSDDVVIMQPSWQWSPFSYALDQATDGPIPERRETRARTHHAEASLDRLRREGRRIWLVIFDYRLAPRIESYPYLDLLEAGRSRVRDDVFHAVRVLLYEPAPVQTR